MATITIPGFGGEVPRTEARMLETHQATTAINCDLRRGSLRPLKGCIRVDSIPASTQTLFMHDTDFWLTWNKWVSVAKSAVLDVPGERPLGHVFITGDRPYPIQRFAGGETWRLGVPRPTTAPTVQAETGGSLGDVAAYAFAAVDGNDMPTLDSTDDLPPLVLDPDDGNDSEILSDLRVQVESAIDGIPQTDSADEITRTSSYCYTLVQSLARGIFKQESANSPPSELITVRTGDGVLVQVFVVDRLPGSNITHIRIYRTVSGNKTADFRFVAEISATQTSYLDTQLDSQLSSEVLQTSTWDMIPDDATGLIRADNGIYAAFRGNELLLSVPFIPYAFPEMYRYTTEDQIVALAHVDGTIVVLTKGRPYLAQGTDPEAILFMQLPIEQPCLSSLSVGNTPGSVVYATHDGLMRFTSGQQTLLTESVFTREQWLDLSPWNLMGSILDGRYIGVFKGSNQGFILDLARQDIVRLRFPDGWIINDLYHYINYDCIYLAVNANGIGGVYRFEGGSPMPYTWVSKTVFTSALVGMSALRIEGEQAPGSPVTAQIYGPANRPRATVSVTDSRTKRIITTRKEKLWSLGLSGLAAVYEARLGTGVEDLEHGS